MKIRKLLRSGIAAYLGCSCTMTGIKPHPFAGTLPRGSTLDVSGTFSVTPTGDLTLALRDGCVSQGRSRKSMAATERPCDKPVRDAIRVMAVTPWNAELRGTWVDAKHLVFHVDWAKTQLDVLSDEALATAARPWTVSGIEWFPSEGDARHVLELVGAATQTETEVVQGGASPKLDVSSFEVDGGLHAGSSATLVVQMVNHGPGVAYRVVAVTRSSMPALHGRRLEFGSIQPGAQKTRQIELEIPSGVTAPDAMVVLLVSEGNGFAPGNLSRRWPVALAEPELATHCTIPAHPTREPAISAGEHLTVRCVVSNTGAGAANIALEVAVNGSILTRTQAQDVLASSRGVFMAPVVIPRELAVNATVQIAITARETRRGRATQTTLSATVGKPKLCDAGKLTRKQYDTKVAELRTTVASGDMTQAQLDRYDAELILCLQ